MPEITLASLDDRQRKLIENARIASGCGQLGYVIAVTGEILREMPACVAARRLQRDAQLRQFERQGGLLAKVKGWAGVVAFLLSPTPKHAGQTLAAAEKLLERDPTSVPALKLLADAALELGWPETAAFAREAVRELRPKDQDNLIALGEAWLGAGRPAEALQLAEEVLRLRPVDGPGLELLRQASIAQTVAAGHWDSIGTFREKLRS